jgi:flagellar biosynthesis/type III secretory pathway M-ring protein FliF/YscJ
MKDIKDMIVDNWNALSKRNKMIAAIGVIIIVAIIIA